MFKKIIILACCSLLFLPLLAAAQIPDAVKAKLTDKLSTSTAAVKGALARCAIVESKIQIKTTNFDNSKVKHLAVYNRVRSSVANITEKLAAKGVDVTSLKAALAIYDQKIKKFSDDYSIYIGKLKDDQAYACGKSEGQFRTKLKEAKTALVQVHKDAVDLRTYYAQTLKPEINKIRAILRNDKATSTATTTTAKMPAVAPIVE